MIFIIKTKLLFILSRMFEASGTGFLLYAIYVYFTKDIEGTVRRRLYSYRGLGK